MRLSWIGGAWILLTVSETVSRGELWVSGFAMHPVG